MMTTKIRANRPLFLIRLPERNVHVIDAAFVIYGMQCKAIIAALKYDRVKTIENMSERARKNVGEGSTS